ncbi:MAG: hypothetical protein BBJ60_05880 [Desulfobacterales bacterium S7086C20]|nr:MAG: hypothetical protein BBJ60_05880 [Desulfobacterales bacterium S7086C20]
MNDATDYLLERFQRLDRKQIFLAGCVLAVFLGALGYFGVSRPRIAMVSDKQGIYIVNRGDMNGLISRVEGFWYWAGQVGFLANMPDIRQEVRPGDKPVRLEIPRVPSPVGVVVHQKPCYMKLIICYHIPGIPVFKYKVNFYFKYDFNQDSWISSKNIPAEFRAFGSMGRGNVKRITEIF